MIFVYSLGGKSAANTKRGTDNRNVLLMSRIVGKRCMSELK